MSKSIVVLAADTVPLPIHKGVLENLDKNSVSQFRNNYTDASESGTRSWKFAEELSKDFDVTLLIPDCYYPEEEYIDKSDLQFELDSYNYRICSWNWSQGLDRKLKKANFVIAPTGFGTGLQNCAVLPSNANLICPAPGWPDLYLSAVSYNRDSPKNVLCLPSIFEYGSPETKETFLASL